LKIKHEKECALFLEIIDWSIDVVWTVDGNGNVGIQQTNSEHGEEEYGIISDNAPPGQILIGEKLVAQFLVRIKRTRLQTLASIWIDIGT